MRSPLGSPLGNGVLRVGFVTLRRGNIYCVRGKLLFSETFIEMWCSLARDWKFITPSDGFTGAIMQGRLTTRALARIRERS